MDNGHHLSPCMVTTTVGGSMDFTFKLHARVCPSYCFAKRHSSELMSGLWAYVSTILKSGIEAKL